MQKQPTIRDVAAAAGVSVAVVSRVLNPGSGPVAAATRGRVSDVMETLGYHPRTAARELKHGPPTTLGLLLADVSNPFFARLADQVVQEAHSRGIQVLLMTTQEDDQLESERLATLIERRVSGIIATPTGNNLDTWKKLQDMGTDVVFVDRSIPALPAVDVVTINNTESARSATALMAAHGHRRIAIISGPASSTTGRDRIAGYREALDAAGLEQDELLIRSAAFRGAAGGDATTALLSLEDPPTALVVANTAQVTAVLRRLAHAGISIPEELSVIVFEDSPWTELMTPPLTIVRQPIDLLARHSVRLALSNPSGKTSGKPTVVRVDAELIERSSVSRPKPRP
ncbi:substrate-binding domain-containing protein [Arthrobacter pascens]|uniref:substrate-binding domain-containing protein n=1 Tax=Arthrobacter pascens TaxID=1677 RepID=UPI00196B1A2A|nr:substrate-binding domain-containing protein [Arthrobacter pascens]MBN3497832.1 substrate-binding domain-containing protein [Arthrobacter pascens]MDR6558868.1 LacI family transcriptional regulator [Arthrobacter pascens]